MKNLLLAAPLFALPGAVLLAGASTQQPDGAAKFFAANCIGCHVPPDPAFKADQAWLGQIAETS